MRAILAAIPAALLLLVPPAVGADETTPAATAASSPVLIAEAAIARSKPSLQCRYAFTLRERGDVDAVWADYEVANDHVLEFDPRRPIGERWRVIENRRKVRAEIRRQFNWGQRSDPRSDLLTVTLEGDIDITNLQLREERRDVWVFDFTPAATDTVHPLGHTYLNALRGELWVSRATGQVVRRTLTMTRAFEEGLGRVRAANYVREYVQGPSGYSYTRGTNQTLSMTVQGRGMDSRGEQVISGITPICDPAEVARIAAMEASDQTYERTERDVTGTRLRVNH